MNVIKLEKKILGSLETQQGDVTICSTKNVSNDSEWLCSQLNETESHPYSRDFASFGLYTNPKNHRLTCLHWQAGLVRFPGNARYYTTRCVYEIEEVFFANAGKDGYDVEGIVNSLPILSKAKERDFSLETSINYSSAPLRNKDNLSTNERRLYDTILFALYKNVVIYLNLDGDYNSYYADKVRTCKKMQTLLKIINSLPPCLRRYSSFLFSVDGNSQFLFGNVLLVAYHSGNNICQIPTPNDDDILLDWTKNEIEGEFPIPLEDGIVDGMNRIAALIPRLLGDNPMTRDNISYVFENAAKQIDDAIKKRDNSKLLQTIFIIGLKEFDKAKKEEKDEKLQQIYRHKDVSQCLLKMIDGGIKIEDGDKIKKQVFVLYPELLKSYINDATLETLTWIFEQYGQNNSIYVAKQICQRLCKLNFISKFDEAECLLHKLIAEYPQLGKQEIEIIRKFFEQQISSIKLLADLTTFYDVYNDSYIFVGEMAAKRACKSKIIDENAFNQIDAFLIKIKTKDSTLDFTFSKTIYQQGLLFVKIKDLGIFYSSHKELFPFISQLVKEKLKVGSVKDLLQLQKDRSKNKLLLKDFKTEIRDSAKAKAKGEFNILLEMFVDPFWEIEVKDLPIYSWTQFGTALDKVSNDKKLTKELIDFFRNRTKSWNEDDLDEDTFKKLRKIEFISNEMLKKMRESHFASYIKEGRYGFLFATNDYNDLLTDYLEKIDDNELNTLEKIKAQKDKCCQRCPQHKEMIEKFFAKKEEPFGPIERAEQKVKSRKKVPLQTQKKEAKDENNTTERKESTNLPLPFEQQPTDDDNENSVKILYESFLRTWDGLCSQPSIKTYIKTLSYAICAVFGFLCGYYFPKTEQHHPEVIVAENQIEQFNYNIEEQQGVVSNCDSILQVLCEKYLSRLHAGELPTIPVEITQGETIVYKDSVKLDGVLSLAPLMGVIYKTCLNTQDSANVLSLVRMVFLSGDTIAVCKDNPLYRLSSLKCFEPTGKKMLFKKTANRVVAILDDDGNLLQMIDNSSFDDVAINKEIGIESVEYYLWLYDSINKKIRNLAY